MAISKPIKPLTSKNPNENNNMVLLIRKLMRNNFPEIVWFIAHCIVVSPYTSQTMKEF